MKFFNLNTGAVRPPDRWRHRWPLRGCLVLPADAAAAQLAPTPSLYLLGSVCEAFEALLLLAGQQLHAPQAPIQNHALLTRIKIREHFRYLALFPSVK